MCEQFYDTLSGPYQYCGTTDEDTIVADDRLLDGLALAGEQVDRTTGAPGSTTR